MRTAKIDFQLGLKLLLKKLQPPMVNLKYSCNLLWEFFRNLFVHSRIYTIDTVKAKKMLSNNNRKEDI